MPSPLFLIAIFSSAFAASPPYGQLSVRGTKLKGSTGQDVALRGMSLYWSQWKGQFYNAQVIQALKCSWNTNVFRAAMAVDNGGYLTNPTVEMEKITTVVQAAIDLGIYVIIDWHTDVIYKSQAVTFFSQMAQKYAGVPNVLYEIYNEPLYLSWTNDLLPYHSAVITAIRKYDTKNVIIVGTPNWSQDVDVASENPIKKESNIMYTLHYYAGAHKQELRNKAQTALKNGLPIFITEYGTTNLEAKGSVNVTETNAWWKFVDDNGISQTNWGINDVDENTAALIPGTPATLSGLSSDASLTTSGKLVKAHYKTQSNGVSCGSSATVSKAIQSEHAGSKSNQYKLPSWANIPSNGQFKGTGISVNGRNSTLPSVNVLSYGCC